MKHVGLLGVVLAVACSSGGPAPAPAPAPADARMNELQASMTELLERLDVMNDRITRLEQAAESQPVAPTRASTTPSAPAAAVGSSATAPVGPSPAAAASRSLSSARIAEAYRNALMLYGKNKWAEARTAFQQVFDADPSGDLADNALFWIGETYYAAGNFNEATRFYKRVATEYGDQNKAPDALFKLGLAYEKTGDLVLARTTLQDVINRYPYASAAASARAELNRIKY